jgi:uncharacterized protein (DUF2336 family)
MAFESLIDEVETAIAGKDINRRAEALRRIADHFASGSRTFSNEQIGLFDEVMDRLARHVDEAARAAFGRRIVTHSDAPEKTLRSLALDDSIAVAGPILTQSAALSEETLIEGAKTKSQDHLMAISRRSTLTEAVTDVLVERGNQEVVRSTAGNMGAQISPGGYSRLVDRAESDDALALSVWKRPDVPRAQLVSLFSAASEQLRAKLHATGAHKSSLLRDVLAQATNIFQDRARETSVDYTAAYEAVNDLHDAGELNEISLRSYAENDRFDETTVALSLLCELPIGVVERAIVHEMPDQLIVMCRSVRYSWDTTKAVLLMQNRLHKGRAQEVGLWADQFERLREDTARKALDFYRMREQAAAHADAAG